MDDDEGCPICGNADFHDEDGRTLCDNGHDQGRGLATAEDDADFGRQGSIVRKKVDREKQKISKGRPTLPSLGGPSGTHCIDDRDSATRSQSLPAFPAILAVHLVEAMSCACAPEGPARRTMGMSISSPLRLSLLLEPSLTTPDYCSRPMDLMAIQTGASIARCQLDRRRSCR